MMLVIWLFWTAMIVETTYENSKQQNITITHRPRIGDIKEK